MKKILTILFSLFVVISYAQIDLEKQSNVNEFLQAKYTIASDADTSSVGDKFIGLRVRSDASNAVFEWTGTKWVLGGKSYSVATVGELTELPCNPSNWAYVSGENAWYYCDGSSWVIVPPTPEIKVQVSTISPNLPTEIGAAVIDDFFFYYNETSDSLYKYGISTDTAIFVKGTSVNLGSIAGITQSNGFIVAINSKGLAPNDSLYIFDTDLNLTDKVLAPHFPTNEITASSLKDGRFVISDFPQITEFYIGEVDKSGSVNIEQKTLPVNVLSRIYCDNGYCITAPKLSTPDSLILMNADLDSVSRTSRMYDDAFLFNGEFFGRYLDTVFVSRISKINTIIDTIIVPSLKLPDGQNRPTIFATDDRLYTLSSTPNWNFSVIDRNTKEQVFSSTAYSRELYFHENGMGLIYVNEGWGNSNFRYVRLEESDIKSVDLDFASISNAHITDLTVQSARIGGLEPNSILYSSLDGVLKSKPSDISFTPSARRLTIGNDISTNSQLFMYGSDVDFRFYEYNSGGTSQRIRFYKSRGTIESPVQIPNSTETGGLMGYGMGTDSTFFNTVHISFLGRPAPTGGGHGEVTFRVMDDQLTGTPPVKFGFAGRENLFYANSNIRIKNNAQFLAYGKDTINGVAATFPAFDTGGNLIESTSPIPSYSTATAPSPSSPGDVHYNTDDQEVKISKDGLTYEQLVPKDTIIMQFPLLKYTGNATDTIASNTKYYATPITQAMLDRELVKWELTTFKDISTQISCVLREEDVATTTVDTLDTDIFEVSEGNSSLNTISGVTMTPGRVLQITTGNTPAPYEATEGANGFYLTLYFVE